MHQQQGGGFPEPLQYGAWSQAEHLARATDPLQDRINPGGKGLCGPVTGFDGQLGALAAAIAPAIGAS